MVGHRLFAALALLMGGVAVLGDSAADETCAADDETCAVKPRQGSAMLQRKKGQVKLQAAKAGAAKEGAAKEGAAKEEAAQEEALEVSGFPRDVGMQLLERQKQGGEHLGADVPQEWIDLTGSNTAVRITATNPDQLTHLTDRNYTTFGGGTIVIIDLGIQYRITQQQLDWRVCKCMLPNAARLMYSEDYQKWTVLENLKDFYVWGGMQRRTYNYDFQARYFAIEALASPVKYVGFWEIGLYGKPIIPKTNVYGWANSYQIGGAADLAGTEILHLVPYKGKLFGGTGYWKNFGKTRSAEVVRLDCKDCDWVIEAQICPYSGRTESLKAISWTTTRTGHPLSTPVDKLIAGFYLDWAGEGQCKYSVRDDTTKVWTSGVYWKKTPFKPHHFSARAFELYQDPVTKIDMLFFVTGLDGIIAGVFEPTSGTWVEFPSHTESGPVETRPLALTVMDGKLYFSASSYIQRRINGQSPSWEKVFDMVDHDKDNTVDEAVGGIRGLSSIAHNGGRSLFFSWSPNAASESCMVRLDPNGHGGFTYNKEKCVKEVEAIHLGKNVHNFPALVVYSIANYNYALEVPTGNDPIYLIGFQALLYAYSVVDFPVDHSQEAYTASGKRMAYFSGAGYMIRKSATEYEARTPGGPRYSVTDVFPKQVAVRALSTSPFADEDIYFGGYDCNHFASQNTAWVQRATKDAAWHKSVPCQKEQGCGHIPGEPFRKHGCQWWPAGATFKPWAVGGFVGATPVSCQATIDALNSDMAGRCEEAKHWPAFNRCNEVDCNLCLLTGKGFRPNDIAGYNGGGVTYSCQIAHDFVKNGGTTCDQGRAWWSGVCCKAEGA